VGDVSLVDERGEVLHRHERDLALFAVVERRGPREACAET
jgi:hypothetical protein